MNTIHLVCPEMLELSSLFLISQEVVIIICVNQSPRADCIDLAFLEISLSLVNVIVEVSELKLLVFGNCPVNAMGMKHFVRFGLYQIKGSVNVQLAEKTGFTYEDAQVVKEALRTLFVNDAASARPDGSMEVVRVYWWEHDCKEGQYPSAQVHRLLKATLKPGVDTPGSMEDYEIHLSTLEGLACEQIKGI